MEALLYRWLWMSLVLSACPAPDTDTDEPIDSDTEVDTTDSDTAPPVGDSDRDGDGTPDLQDCAPDDPTIHPLAIDTCDEIDRDCDGNPSDSNTLWFVGEDGSTADLSQTLSALPTEPVEWRPPVSGTLRMCPGSYAITFVLEDVDLDIVGVGTNDTVNLDVEGGGRAIHLLGNATLTMSDVSVRAGISPELEAPVALVEGGSTLELTRVLAVDVDGIPGDPYTAATIRLLDGDNTLVVDDGKFARVGTVFAGGAGTHITLDNTLVDTTTGPVGVSAGTLSMTNTQIVNVASGLISEGADVTLTDVSITDAGDPSGLTSPIMFTSTDPGTLLTATNLAFRNIEGSAMDLEATAIDIDGLELGQVFSTEESPVRLRSGVVSLTDLDSSGTGGPGDGGALHVGAAVTMDCTDCTVQNARAGGNGGAIFLEGDLSATNLQLVTNGALGHGGALYLDRGSFNVDGLVVNRNDAAGDGGGLWLRPSLSQDTVVIDDLGATGNEATRGGVIWATDTVLEVHTANIQNNMASDEGGALWVERTLRLTDAVLIDNTAEATGGAITSQQVLVTGGRLQRNIANMGGGIEYRSSLLLDAVEFGGGTDANVPSAVMSATGLPTDLSGTVSGTCIATGCTLQ